MCCNAIFDYVSFVLNFVVWILLMYWLCSKCCGAGGAVDYKCKMKKTKVAVPAYTPLAFLCCRGLGIILQTETIRIE